MALRVVSLPATTSKIKNEPNSCAVRLSPSTSAAIMTLVMSSRGFALRFSPSAWAYAKISIPTLSKSSYDVTNSGSPTPRIVLVQRKISEWSDSGTPIMSQMISNGSGAATCSTKSHERPGKSCSKRSTTFAARIFTWSSTRAISRGPKPFATMLRRRKCFGSSMAIMEPKNSLSSMGRSPIFDPCPLQNSAALRLTCQMSSWRVSARYPRPGGNGESGITVSSKNWNGDSSRKVLKAPSRQSRGAVQKVSLERLMSESGTLGNCMGK